MCASRTVIITISGDIEYCYDDVRGMERHVSRADNLRTCGRLASALNGLSALMSAGSRLLCYFDLCGKYDGHAAAL